MTMFGSSSAISILYAMPPPVSTLVIVLPQRLYRTGTPHMRTDAPAPHPDKTLPEKKAHRVADFDQDNGEPVRLRLVPESACCGG